MKGTIQIPGHKQNPTNLAVLLGLVAGISTPSKADMKDPRVAKAYAQVAAIEPAVAYLANKRGKNLSTPGAFDMLLEDIRENRLTARDRFGIAKIYDSHVRIGNLQAKGLDGITGKNFQPSIATLQAAGQVTWGDNTFAQERYGEFQQVVQAYFDAKPSFVN